MMCSPYDDPEWAARLASEELATEHLHLVAELEQQIADGDDQ